MKKSTLIISTLAIVLGCSNAYAEGFTYETTQSSSKTIGGVGQSGMEAMGTHATGKSTTTNEDGTKTVSDWECVSMANPTNSKIFDAHMACDVVDKDGSFSLVLGCQVINPEDGTASCVGGMKGKTGAYKDRYGNFSQISKGGTGNGKGSGQWFD